MANSIKDEIKELYREGDLLTKIILINCGVFLAVALVDVVFFLAQSHFRVGEWLALPAEGVMSLTRFWTLVTYMFLHEDFIHFIFNILMLYWIGRLFALFFSSRDMVNMYIFGGLVGGLTFIASYNFFPVFSSHVHYASLRGASASVMALLVAVASYQPDYKVRFALIGEFAVKWVALVMVLISLINVHSENPGGNFAHLGGALAGYLFTFYYKKGRNIAAWIGRILDGVSNMFNRKPKWKVVVNNYENSHFNQKDADYNMRKKLEMDEIDRILDKIKRSGFDSLTDEEKQKLMKAGKK